MKFRIFILILAIFSIQPAIAGDGGVFDIASFVEANIGHVDGYRVGPWKAVQPECTMSFQKEVPQPDRSAMEQIQFSLTFHRPGFYTTAFVKTWQVHDYWSIQDKAVRFFKPNNEINAWFVVEPATLKVTRIDYPDTGDSCIFQ
ncbi:MAG: hypothetical protein ACXVB1_09615 [Pseudobdellovibrionaceae bacterium]